MAVLQVLLLLLVPTLTGTLIVRHALGRAGLVDALTGSLPLGLGLGLGLSGLLAFASLVFVDTIALTWEFVLCVLVVYISAKRKTWSRFSGCREKPTPPGRLVVVGACVLILVSVFAYVVQSNQAPHGGWDAWDFWNMRARFFHRGGASWVDSFSQIPWWSHPEYPVLLPAMVARGFRLLNAEDPLSPMLLGFTYTFASVSVLYFGVSQLRGRSQALLAALVLCCTPYFLFHGTEQYADNPLAFFFLATVVCAALYDQNSARKGALVLSGLFAGLAAFLKDEGILFLVCFSLARSVWLLRKEGRAVWKQQAFYFAMGALPGVCATVLFKTSYSVMPDNAEFFPRPWINWKQSFIDHVAAQASDTTRYRDFFRAWWYQLGRFDRWVIPLVFLLPAYGMLMGLFPGRPRPIVRVMLGTYLLQIIGVSLAFLFWSTYPIFDHMDAVARLLMQMTPTVLFVMFVSVRTPWEVTLEPARAHPE